MTTEQEPGKRVYKFPLPYTISGLQDEIGVERLKSANLWDQVPPDIQTRLINGEGFFGAGATITQADLDRLPDPVWTYIASQLDLDWSVA